MEKEIHALIDGKVLTPNLIYADETHEPFPYAIFQFIDGRHISEVSREHKKTLSYELGQTLASIHAFKFQEAGLFGEGIIIAKPFDAGSSPYFEEAFSVLSKGKYAPTRLGDKLSDEMLTFMKKNQDFFPKVEKNICLTHSDFKPVNLLYNKGKIFVLDWEFAHAGIGILDFAILLRHHDQFPLDLDALIRGYSDSGGVLPYEWLRSAFITDFVNIIQMLEAPTDRPKLFHQLKSAAQTTMNQWDSLSNTTHYF
jgi:Ser/Thr protein kinase RdoA (MazF antagonist)